MKTHDATASVLDRLLPGRVEQFLACYPTLPFHHAGPLARLPDFVAGLSLERLAAVYRGDVGLHAADSRPVALHDPPADAIAWLARCSAGMTFESIERVIPGLEAWCRALRRALRLPAHALATRCNAFASPPSAGYRFHFHYEGALLVQLAGRKHVRLAPVESPFPVVQTDDNQRFEGEFELEPRPMAAYAQFATTGFPRPPADDEGEGHELGPGSVLYIPPGWWHATRVLGDERSFAFSFFLATPRLYEGFLRALELALLTDPAWREPVAPRNAGPTSTSSLESMRARLAEVAGGLRAEDVRACLVAGDPLDRHSTLCPNTDVRWSVEPASEGAAFSIHADRRYELEAGEPTATVLRALLGRSTPFTVADALRDAGPTAGEVVHAAIELLEEMGALVRAPFRLHAPVGTESAA